MLKKEILVYTDGSADNSKTRQGAREGGIGIVIRMLDETGTLHKKDHSEGKWLNVTSSRMEVMAIKRALEIISPSKDHKIIIHSDNEYCVNSINKGWLSNWIENNDLQRANFDLWVVIAELLRSHYSVEIKWLRGHSGQEYNELADRLANEGRLSKEILK